MAKKRKSGKKLGRPPSGREWVRFQAILLKEQKERLDFLSRHLPENPGISGMLRAAVAEYLEKRFNKEVEKAYEEEQKKEIRLVK